MSFTEAQREQLAGPLNRAHVKPPAPGKYGDYIEGWRTIDEANRIFGFDGWTRETLEMTERNRELLELVDKHGKPYKQWRVAFMAKVRVSAGGIFREGTGFGHGQGKPESLGDAIESAAKEAETDAMKRALMTFGNPFGLALYDKTKSNVQDMPDPPSASVQIALDAVAKCDTQPMLKQWWDTHGPAFEGDGKETVLAAVNKRLAAIKTMDQSRAA